MNPPDVRLIIKKDADSFYHIPAGNSVWVSGDCSVCGFQPYDAGISQTVLQHPVVRRACAMGADERTEYYCVPCALAEFEFLKMPVKYLGAL